MTQGPASYEETSPGSQVGQHGGQVRPCLSKGTGTSDTGKSSGSLPSLPSRGGESRQEAAPSPWLRLQWALLWGLSNTAAGALIYLSVTSFHIREVSLQTSVRIHAVALKSNAEGP